jgi:excisionase family DNA binding protein
MRLDMLPSLLTTQAVAEYLGVKTKTTHQLVREGKLSCIQLSPKDRKFTEDQLKAYLDSRTVAAPKLIDKKASKTLPLKLKGGETRKSQ